MGSPMMVDSNLATITQRREIARYEAAGREYLVNSQPYWSTLPLFGLVRALATVAGANPKGYILFNKGQELNFFSYGAQGSPTNGGPSARLDDTNLKEPFRTVEAEDFVVQTIGCAHRSTKLNYPDATFLGQSAAQPMDAAADAIILNALGVPQGVQQEAVIYDPGALLVPVQAQSPVTLEDAIYQAIAPHMSLKFQWNDGSRQEQIGVMSMFPEGGARSPFRSAGQPFVQNQMEFPEGWIWASEGVDRNFACIARLERPVIVPIEAAYFPSTDPTAQAPTFGVLPTGITMDLQVLLGGIGFKYPSQN